MTENIDIYSTTIKIEYRTTLRLRIGLLLCKAAAWFLKGAPMDVKVTEA